MNTYIETAAKLFDLFLSLLDERARFEIQEALSALTEWLDEVKQFIGHIKEVQRRFELTVDM